MAEAIVRPFWKGEEILEKILDSAANEGTRSSLAALLEGQHELDRYVSSLWTVTEKDHGGINTDKERRVKRRKTDDHGIYVDPREDSESAIDPALRTEQPNSPHFDANQVTAVIREENEDDYPGTNDPAVEVVSKPSSKRSPDALEDASTTTTKQPLSTAEEKTLKKYH